MKWFKGRLCFSSRRYSFSVSGLFDDQVGWATTRIVFFPSVLTYVTIQKVLQWLAAASQRVRSFSSLRLKHTPEFPPSRGRVSVEVTMTPHRVRLTHWCVLGDAEQGHVPTCAAGSIVIKVWSIVWLPFKAKKKHAIWVGRDHRTFLTTS